MRSKSTVQKIKLERDQLLSALPEDATEIGQAVDSLVDRMAFMKVILENLEADVRKNGPVVDFVNGSQEMVIENPAQKSYNTMIARYLAALKQYVALFPKENQSQEVDDGFDKFVSDRGD